MQIISAIVETIMFGFFGIIFGISNTVHDFISPIHAKTTFSCENSNLRMTVQVYPPIRKAEKSPNGTPITMISHGPCTSFILMDNETQVYSGCEPLLDTPKKYIDDTIRCFKQHGDEIRRMESKSAY